MPTATFVSFNQPRVPGSAASTEALPDKASMGFRIEFELKEHLYAAKGGVVTITVVLMETPEMQVGFSLVSGVIGSCLAAAAGALSQTFYTPVQDGARPPLANVAYPKWTDAFYSV